MKKIFCWIAMLKLFLIFVKAALEDLINKDPLCEISEQDKTLVWKHREYCLAEFPQSLPRLVAAVKWSSRENTAIVSLGFVNIRWAFFNLTWFVNLVF